jgi:type I restriction enzyme M protein
MANGNGKQSATVSQAEINSILWKACDTFRGAVDPSEYKNYILVMLFVKYISDVWQDHYDGLVAEYGDPKSKAAKERIERRLKRERFVLPAHCTFTALYEQRNAANVGEVINTALDEIEDSNKEKLEGVFRNIDFNSEASLGQTKERNNRLKSLLEDFSDPKLDLRPSRVGTMDVIGNAYEYLIGKFAANAGKKAGEFYTPPEVSQLIARLVDPQPGERICDPACGSGSLLIKCGQQVGSKDFSLWGQENIGATWALAKMNMFLHGMDNARIEWGDTIRNPKLLADDRLMKFEVVVANPPFSLDKWGQDEAGADHYNRFHRGVPPKSKGDYAFISHMIETITETSGRVGVVVPHGVLFRGSSEGKIRQQLIEENLLDAVVGLPANLFYGTGIPAAILVFRKQKPPLHDSPSRDGKKSRLGESSNRTVLFIDASREYDDAKTQNRLADQHIEKIVATYKARQNVDKYAYVADIDEINENDFNLNIPRYVDTFEEEEEIDVRAVQEEIDELDGELAQVQEQMHGYLKELGL